MSFLSTQTRKGVKNALIIDSPFSGMIELDEFIAIVKIVLKESSEEAIFLDPVDMLSTESL